VRVARLVLWSDTSLVVDDFQYPSILLQGSVYWRWNDRYRFPGEEAVCKPCLGGCVGHDHFIDNNGTMGQWGLVTDHTPTLPAKYPGNRIGICRITMGVWGWLTSQGSVNCSGGKVLCNDRYWFSGEVNRSIGPYVSHF
jgi:hypothetical protein